MIDLVAQERKFVANSRLKNAEKIIFSGNLVPIKIVSLLPFFLKDPVEGDFCSIPCTDVKSAFDTK